jgi:hypothetical protein
VLDEYIAIKEYDFENGKSVAINEDYISVEDALEYGNMREIRKEKGRKVWIKSV